jgi:hypothetical protein
MFPPSSGGTYGLGPVGSDLVGGVTSGTGLTPGDRVGIVTGGETGLTVGVGAGAAVTVGAGLGGMPLSPVRQDLA